MDGYGFTSSFIDGYGWIWITQTLSMSISTRHRHSDPAAPPPPTSSHPRPSPAVPGGGIARGGDQRSVQQCRLVGGERSRRAASDPYLTAADAHTRFSNGRDTNSRLGLKGRWAPW